VNTCQRSKDALWGGGRGGSSSPTTTTTFTITKSICLQLKTKTNDIVDHHEINVVDHHQANDNDQEENDMDRRRPPLRGDREEQDDSSPPKIYLLEVDPL
jgi:hypothetical protein